MLKPICFAAALIFLNIGMAQKRVTNNSNRLNALEKSSGWKLLFDGKTTKGWHAYGINTISPEWKIEDGTLMLEPDKTIQNRHGVDLVTNDTYGNFDLKLDWRIGPKANSGIIFYIQEDSAKYHETFNTGLEMQVLDNGTSTRLGHPDARLYTHRAGDLYDLIAGKEAAHPQGEWNHAEIISLNGKLDFYLNGVHTLSTTLWNDTWKQMVAISKFKDMQGWGTFKQGKISLQDHGEEVGFKNVRIKRL